MMRCFELKWWFVYISIFVSGSTYSQRKAVDLVRDSIDHEKFMFLINANREQSYITITEGFGNLEPLLMEAKLSPSYFFSRKKKTWALLLNPQVQIRMQNTESWPINTPSYKAHLTFFHSIDFWQRSFLKKLFFENALWSVTVGHHSNGKAGSYYINDTTKVIDMEDGNFATNYMIGSISTYKAKLIRRNMVAFRSIKGSVEIHPRPWSVEEIRDSYGRYRFFGTLGMGGPWREAKKTWANRWLQQSSIELQVGWIAGKMDSKSPVDVSKRLIIDIHYQYYPEWFDEIAFFLRYYRGQDYYNLYFVNTIYVVSFGLTSNILSPRQAIKFFKNKNSY
ncbi:hypothetical protein [Ohtaekwangia koreensis]|uniref:Uncharacterized protein n=1 Tax=Ohtaekwangia koreensis TaxID=688867 RepID=A0A1T5MG11_9BACT|nr:hypothetical protein [Ohtaekwangia koreensis]SKC87196.1 hypothetical protein SAMN05660236_5352 [Ohtaekwangia koreensis]